MPRERERKTTIVAKCFQRESTGNYKSLSESWARWWGKDTAEIWQGSGRRQTVLRPSLSISLQGLASLLHTVTIFLKAGSRQSVYAFVVHGDAVGWNLGKKSPIPAPAGMFLQEGTSRTPAECLFLDCISGRYSTSKNKKRTRFLFAFKNFLKKKKLGERELPK